MKLKAFTIIELIVALLIGSIVILSASFLLISITKQSNLFRIRQNHEVQYDKLIYLLEKDMDYSSNIEIKDNTLSFFKNDSLFSEYDLFKDKIVRKYYLKNNEFEMNGEVISKELIITLNGFTCVNLVIDGKEYSLIKQFSAVELTKTQKQQNGGY
jgi:prepilin-type N-terminal cleavage/methylation domain-containing protein